MEEMKKKFCQIEGCVIEDSSCCGHFDKKQKFLYISDRENIVYVKKRKSIFSCCFFGSSVCSAIFYQGVIERLEVERYPSHIS